jgi:hypothetical protein
LFGNGLKLPRKKKFFLLILRVISQYNRLMSLYNRLTETGPQNQQKKKKKMRGDLRQFSNKNVHI